MGADSEHVMTWEQETLVIGAKQMQLWRGKAMHLAPSDSQQYHIFQNPMIC